ncbi:MAG TPA: hypothetical protein VM925_19805 [Labilithrix sp.]|nr:hypothetical protein [Labilithrix sp.]
MADKVGVARAREPDREDKTEQEPFDPLDPTSRWTAQLAPPGLTMSSIEPAASSTSTEIAPHARVSMEELVPQLVKRIAWAGDRKRGTVHLELGAGPHAGTIVTVFSDAGRVRVELQGASADALRPRIEARLRQRGLDVESVS